ncbi:MAG: hypothetical protein ACRC18_06480 [Cetobacterium sp.]
MSENKKKTYQSISVSGEALNITNFELINENTRDERIVFKLHIETAPNEVRVVTFDQNRFFPSGAENSKFKGAATIYQELETRSDSGKGELVRCNCKIRTDEYYKDGQLRHFETIKVEFCNREKEGKSNFKIYPGQSFVIDTLIESTEMKKDILGDYLEVRGLIYDYTNKDNESVGGYVNYRIHDEELIEGFKSMYPIGSIGQLRGVIGEAVKTESSSKRGFGSAVKPKTIRQIWLEIDGGEEPYNVTYNEETDEIESVNDITEEHPFSNVNIEKMKSKLSKRLNDSKVKDDKNMKNTTNVNEEDVVF